MYLNIFTYIFSVVGTFLTPTPPERAPAYMAPCMQAASAEGLAGASRTLCRQVASSLCRARADELRPECRSRHGQAVLSSAVLLPASMYGTLPTVPLRWPSFSFNDAGLASANTSLWPCLIRVDTRCRVASLLIANDESLPSCAACVKRICYVHVRYMQ